MSQTERETNFCLGRNILKTQNHIYEEKFKVWNSRKHFIYWIYSVDFDQVNIWLSCVIQKGFTHDNLCRKKKLSLAMSLLNLCSCKSFDII